MLQSWGTHGSVQIPVKHRGHLRVIFAASRPLSGRPPRLHGQLLVLYTRAVSLDSKRATPAFLASSMPPRRGKAAAEREEERSDDDAEGSSGGEGGGVEDDEAKQEAR